MAANTTSVGARLGRLEAEVEGIQGTLNTISRKLDNTGKVQWSPIIAAVSLIVTILGGLIVLGSRGPVNDLDRHEALISSITKSRFTKEDFSNFIAMYYRDYDRFERNLEKIEDMLREHQSDGHADRLHEVELEQRRRASRVYDKENK